MQIAAIVISVLGSIVSGAVLSLLKLYFGKRDKQEEQDASRKKEKDKLLFRSIKAVGDLASASAKALVEGKANGECHKALKDYETVDKEVYNFLLSNE